MYAFQLHTVRIETFDESRHRGTKREIRDLVPEIDLSTGYSTR